MDARAKLSVPYEVLLMIAAFADRKSLLTLLATCRSLHSDCAKYVLQDPVQLCGDRDIISFILFMRPHDCKRWRHLRSLRFFGERIDSLVAKGLAKAIRRASHLESLVFNHAERTLGAHPDLPLAFAAIRTVKHLVIDYGYQHTCRMLEAMHWPLESVVLNRTDFRSGWRDPDHLDRMHPAALLKNSCATLKTLECESWCECSSTLDTYPVYPELESLYLEAVWCPRAAQWAVSYPALKRLSVSTIDSHFMEVDEDYLAAHSANRLLNLHEFTALPQKWNELEQFDGDTLDLYLLGLPCHVQDVTLTLSPDSLQFFAPVMTTARPTRLRLSINTHLFNQPVPTYLQDPGLADLKSLELRVVSWVGDTDVDDGGDPDVDRFLRHALDTLQRASAREFVFYLTIGTSGTRATLDALSPEPDDPIEQGRPATATRRPATPAPVVEAPPISAVEAWATTADLDALVLRFLDEVPSLESVKLSVQPWSPSSLMNSRSAESSRARNLSVEAKDVPLVVSEA
ncbi:hypothetical protein GSI_13019 [Ganoderma sinense ZZ0214-1]|uniref:F-box domain-containing protein n=1 Tax=Ganoderma sinense ZZ0214-1 TaxID=1077348 RepID=A0A2G8RUE1_9APHY|nr:hypothetical protein GSI_13019 [Ganoderma sinense ZZ0214-1]